MANVSKKKDGFGGTLLDLGSKKAEGIHDVKDKTGFAGHFSDMGSKDAIGVKGKKK